MAARPAVVGGFVLAGMGLAVAIILFFGGLRLFEQTTRAVIFFEGSVAGLDLGAPVTFRGVRVGSVESMSIDLTTVGEARIPVVINLLPGRVRVDGADPQRSEDDIRRLVMLGLRAQLTLQSFVTGQLMIDLDFRPGTPGEQVADISLPQIPAIPSDLERLRSTLEEVPLREVVEIARRVLLSVEQLVGRLDAELGPLLDSTRRGVETATRALDAAEQAVVGLRADASGTLREVDSLAADARQQLDLRGAELARALVSAERATRHMEALLTSVEGLIEPRSQLRSDLEAAARDLSASASSLRSFARTVERDPSALLRGRNAR